jgi:hypothetical protein
MTAPRFGRTLFTIAMPFGSPRARILRQTVDDCPRLNVHTLHQAGALVAGAVSRWQWPHPVAPLDVRARCDGGRLLLSLNGGVEMLVSIAREPGTLGNDYPIFECPGCGVRRWNLYVKDEQLACRICLRLDYASRHTNRWSPALRRVAKLRGRLGAAPAVLSPLPPRPRRFPQRRTYDRLVAQLAIYEAKAQAAFDDMIAAIERRQKGMRK